MPDGKPDLTGVWQGGSTARGTWEEANTGTGVGGTGRDPSAPAALLSASTGRRSRTALPISPGRPRRFSSRSTSSGIDDPTARCLPPGIPRTSLLGLFPTQIIQTPEQIVILYEYMNVFRVIPLNAKHPDDLVPTYMGDSVAHWEGDTLVVDVTGFNDKTWLVRHRHISLGSAARHRALHARGQRPDQLRRDDGRSQGADQAVDDPFDLMLREGTRLQEYVCAENNLDPGHYEDLLKNGIKFTRP